MEPKNRTAVLSQPKSQEKKKAASTSNAPGRLHRSQTRAPANGRHLRPRTACCRRPLQEAQHQSGTLPIVRQGTPPTIVSKNSACRSGIQFQNLSQLTSCRYAQGAVSVEWETGRRARGPTCDAPPNFSRPRESPIHHKAGRLSLNQHETAADQALDPCQPANSQSPGRLPSPSCSLVGCRPLSSPFVSFPFNNSSDQFLRSRHPLCQVRMLPILPGLREGMSARFENPRCLETSTVYSSVSTIYS